MGKHRRDKKIRRLIRGVSKVQIIKLVLAADAALRWYCMFRPATFTKMGVPFHHQCLNKQCRGMWRGPATDGCPWCGESETENLSGGRYA